MSNFPHGSTVGEFEILHEANHGSIGDPHPQYLTFKPLGKTAATKTGESGWVKIFKINLSLSKYERIFMKMSIQGGETSLDTFLTGELDIDYRIISAATKKTEINFVNKNLKITKDFFRLYESVSGDTITLTMFAYIDIEKEAYWFSPRFTAGYKNGVLQRSEFTFYDYLEPLVPTASLPATTYYTNRTTYLRKELCKVYHNVDYLLANNLESTLVFNTEAFDNTGMHVTSGNTTIVNILQGGLYFVKGQVGIASNATGLRKVQVYKNGAKIGEKSIAASAIEDTIVEFNDVFEFVAGDQITFKAFQDSGVNLNIISSKTSCTVSSI